MKPAIAPIGNITPADPGSVATRAGANMAAAKAGSSQAAPTDAFRKFESMFLSQLISVMFQSTENGIAGGSTAGSVHASWFSHAVAEQIAARGGIGLADQLAQLDLQSRISDDNGNKR